MTTSLRRELTKSLCVPITVALFIIGLIGFWSAHVKINAAYDSQLLTDSNVLWLLVKGSLAEQQEPFTMETPDIDTGNMTSEQFQKDVEWRAFRIWKDGKILFESDNAPPPSVPASSWGFSKVNFDGNNWHVYARYITDEQVIVEVFENDNERKELINQIMQGLIWPLLLSLPVIAILIWKGIDVGLRELKCVTAQVEARSADELLPLSQSSVICDLLPLINAINSLLAKLEESFERERQFTDNAAHELRTPIAALKIQAQIAKRSTNNEERNQAIDTLLEGVSRSSQLIDQLLLLARLDSDRSSESSVVLHDAIVSAVSDVQQRIAQKNIDIEFHGDQKLSVNTKPQLLAILLNNLLDNAVKYTPANGKINLRIDQENSKTTIEITDTGPGIPENEWQNVFQRFYRLPLNKEQGSGLGLSIVRHITQLLHSSVEIFTPNTGKGTGVRICFH